MVGESAERAADRVIVVASAAPPPTPQPTPLPYKRLFAVLILLINEGIAAGMLFPFVGFYVAYLTDWTTDEAGYASGCLVAAFQLGQVATGKFWGRAADRYGRRPVMLVTQLLCCFSVFLFGLSPNLVSALIARFLHGLFSGSVAIAKVYTTEITDGTNESKAFVLFPLGWGVGMLIGPFFGGLLYDPARNAHLAWANLSNSSVFMQFPALLPCAVASAFTGLAFLVSLFAFEETLAKPLPLRTVCPRWFARGPRVDRESPATPPTTYRSDAQQAAAKRRVTTQSGGTDADLNSRGTGTDASVELSGQPIGSVGEGAVDAVQFGASSTQALGYAVSIAAPEVVVESPADLGDSTEPEVARLTERQPFGYADIFGRPSHLRSAVVAYMLLCLVEYGTDQVQPLWMIATVGSGGMAMSATMVGTVIFVTAVVALPSILCYPFALALVRDRVRFFQTTTVLWAVSLIVPPFLTMFCSGSLALVLVGAALVVRSVANGFAFSTVYLFIAAVGPVEHLATLNGIARSCACACRAVIAVVAPSLFALSIQHRAPPFVGHYTVFVLLGLVMAATAFLMHGFKGVRK